jgi:serpin B
MEEPGFQAVVLPYRGNRFSLAVLLPRKEDGLAAFEKELTAEQLTGWLARCKPRPVDVYLPRFQFSSGGSLKGPLTALGMRCAFDRSRADFSGMSPTKELFVSEVVQQTFVAVNEEGAEAAGATAIYMEKKEERKEEEPGPTAIVFRADHPFLFLIRDERSGCILFAGRLTDPRTAQPRESKRVPRDLEQPPPKKKADE